MISTASFLSVNVRSTGRVFTLTALLVLSLALPQRCAAQVLYGSLVGNATDPSGAAIPDATVAITQTQTGFTRQATTDQTGGYNLPTIPAGNYTIKVGKAGFKTFERANVPVTVNTVTRVDVKLEVGAVTQTVEVTAAPPLLTTDRADVHQDLSSTTMENLPIPVGRNYQQLFRTIPGFSPPRNAHSVPSNPSRSLQYNVNGTSSSSNDVRVDGASQFNVWLPHVTAYVPALDAIQTVNVVTNSFTAEQGLAGGSVVSVQVKSGTNSLHGSLYEFHNDNKTEARPFLFDKHLERNPKDIFNQFGGTVGGPIKRDKVFFFAGYEGTKLNQLATRFGTVPTTEMRNGDLRASDRFVYDPTTGKTDGSGRVPVSCGGVQNMICPAAIDPIAAKILSLLPLPNVSTTRLSNNFLAINPFTFDRKTIDAKIDWIAASRFTMYGRWSFLHYSDFAPEMFGALGGPHTSNFGGNPGKGSGYTNSFTIAGTYTVNPNFIIDAHFGYTMMDTKSQQSRLNEKLGLDFLGLPGTNGTRLFEGGWPGFVISGFTRMGIEDNFMPYFRHDPQQHYVANATWIRGTHSVRFGADFGRLALNHTQAEFPDALGGAQGAFLWDGGTTGCKGTDALGKKCPSTNSFNSFGAFLLGFVSRRGKNIQVPDKFTTRTKEFAFYIGDQWRTTPKLTLTFGTRFEYFPIPGRADRGLERYDAVNNVMLVCGVGQVPHDCGVDYGKLKLAPRFGFAYRVTPSFVVRAGYGITSDPYDLERPLRTNYPTLVPLTVTPVNSFQNVGKFGLGIPEASQPIPSAGNGIVPIQGNIATSTLPPKFKRGYIQSWNLTLEKEFARGWVGQAAYVATRSVNQLGVLDMNVGQLGGGNASRPLNVLFGRTAATEFVQPVGNTHYDSLQTSLKHRFSAGYEVQVAYTYSKTLGIAGIANSDNGPRIKLPQFYFLNRGVTTLDQPHNFEAALAAELPFGRGKRWANAGGPASKVLGGWQVNGLFSRFSGAVASVTASGTSLNAPGNDQRADRVKSNIQILGGHGPGQPYFDPFAFAAVTDARFGTAAFNLLHGPRVSNLDLGIFREFAITERWRLQFRAESFNATNTPAFAFGNVASNNNNNVSSMTLNTDGTIKALNEYDEITRQPNVGRENGQQRVFRFGLHMSF